MKPSPAMGVQITGEVASTGFGEHQETVRKSDPFIMMVTRVGIVLNVLLLRGGRPSAGPNANASDATWAISLMLKDLILRGGLLD